MAGGARSKEYLGQKSIEVADCASKRSGVSPAPPPRVTQNGILAATRSHRSGAGVEVELWPIARQRLIPHETIKLGQRRHEFD